MAKLVGLGGITEKAPTGRNVAQQKLGVAVYKFDESAKLKGIVGVPGFLDLEKKIAKIMKEIAKLQGELGGLEVRRDAIIELRRKMAEAFQDFMNGVLRIGRGSLSIIKLVDPTFPDDASKVDIDLKIADPIFQGILYNYAQSMTDETFADIETAVREGSSVDFARTFGKFTNLRNAFAKVSGDLPEIESNIEEKQGEIRIKDGEKAGIEGSYNELKPLYDEMIRLEGSASLRTGASRILWATVGAAALALGSANGVAPSPAAKPQALRTPNAVNQNPNVLLGHQVSLNGNIIQVTPNSTQTGNAYPGNIGIYKLNVSGDITQGATGTLTYKLGTNAIATIPVTLVSGINQVQLAGGPQISIQLVASGNTVALKIVD